MKRSFQSGSQKGKRKREHDRVIYQLPTVDRYFSGIQGDLRLLQLDLLEILSS